jgi:hypothetical protein
MKEPALRTRTKNLALRIKNLFLNDLGNVAEPLNIKRVGRQEIATTQGKKEKSMRKCSLRASE